MAIAEQSRNDAFLKAVSSTMLTKFVLIGLKLAISVITARFLGPAGRGQFFAIIQLSGLSATIGAMSSGEGLLYEIGKNKVQSRQIFATVIILSGIFSIISLTAFFLIFPLIPSSIFSEMPGGFIVLFTLFIPFMIIEYISSSALKGLKNFTLVNWISVCTRLTPLACFAVSFLVWGASIEVALTAYAAALAFNALVFAVVLFQISGRIIKIAKKRILPTIKYGFSVHIGTVLNEIEYRVDTLILLYFIDVAAVGIYSIGVSFSQFLWYASNSINTVLFPYLVDPNGEDRDKFTSSVMKYSIYINFLALCFFIAIGYPLVILMYGYDFRDAFFVFLVLAPGILADTASRTIFSWLKGRGNPSVFSWISLVTLVLNLGLNLYLVPSFGLLGAAAASALTYSARSAFLLCLFSRSTNIALLKIFIITKSEIRSVIVALRRLVAS